MAQTSDSIWGGAAKVEISTDGSDWTDISGHANKVMPDDAARRVGEKYTFDGETPIVKVGKRESISISVGIIYTEEAADAYEVARGQFESTGGGSFYLRWAPGGGDSGEKQYTTDEGFVKSFPYAPVDSEEDGPMSLEFEVQTADITSSTIST